MHEQFFIGLGLGGGLAISEVFPRLFQVAALGGVIWAAWRLVQGGYSELQQGLSDVLQYVAPYGELILGGALGVVAGMALLKLLAPRSAT